MDRTRTKALLRKIFDAAVAAAHPASCLPPALPDAPAAGRIIVLAAGKAAGSMSEVAERHYFERGIPARAARGNRRHPPRLWPADPTDRDGGGRPSGARRRAALAATERVLLLAQSAKETDLVLVLLSGGASANWIAPAPGVSLDDKRALTRALLASGADIREINTVRKHLSRIKGGRLAALAGRAKMLTLAISDVPGDDPSVIGSGPTVPDPEHARRRRDDPAAAKGGNAACRSRAPCASPRTKPRSPAPPSSRAANTASSRAPPMRLPRPRARRARKA